MRSHDAFSPLAKMTQCLHIWRSFSLLHFPIVFMWLSSSILLQNPSTSCFGEAQKHFFHNQDWEQSLKCHWDQGEISISVWVQIVVFFSHVGQCSTQVVKEDVNFVIFHESWQPERDVLLLGLRGLCFTILCRM